VGRDPGGGGEDEKTVLWGVDVTSGSLGLGRSPCGLKIPDLRTRGVLGVMKAGVINCLGD